MRAWTLLVLQTLVLAACRQPIEPPRAVEPAADATEDAEPLVVAPESCTYDDECPLGEICDGEACLRAPAEPSAADACGVPPIEFARDSARLSPNNQARLAAARTCLGAAKLELVACREQGEAPELAERRAASVRGMLEQLDVALDHVATTTCASATTRSVGLSQRP